MSKLNLITNPGKFALKNSGHKKFRFRGNNVNLEEIEEADAERLASDPGCTFLQLKDAPLAAPATSSTPPKAEEKK
jgi:hypothetical protein